MRRRLAIWTPIALACLAVIWGTVILYAAGTPKDAKYTGSKKCRSCHLKEHKTWRKAKHSKTFKQLEGPEQKDPDCLKCHTTGYGKPSGFVSLEETPDLASTGCEACHGPGSAHAEAAKDAPEEGKWDMKIDKMPQHACAKCHNPHVPQKERVAKLRAARNS